MVGIARIRVLRIDDASFERLKDASSFHILEKFTTIGDIECWTVQPHDTKKIMLMVFQDDKLKEAVEIYDAENNL